MGDHFSPSTRRQVHKNCAHFRSKTGDKSTVSVVLSSPWETMQLKFVVAISYLLRLFGDVIYLRMTTDQKVVKIICLGFVNGEILSNSMDLIRYLACITIYC